MRVVLVSGGSRGIGRACVQKFAESEDTVIFLYAHDDERASKTAQESGARAIKVDISDSAAVSVVVKRILEEYGRIDVLVNNAGVSHISCFDQMDDEIWQNLVGVNLSGAVYLAREVSRAMIARKSGVIVNIGSIWGRIGASCEVGYSATKAGLRGLTTALAKELGPSGIRVNCVEPGVIDTEMNSHLGADVLQDLADETPLCRIGTPNDVAEAVFFLCSDAASFITGQCLGVDGGIVTG